MKAFDYKFNLRKEHREGKCMSGNIKMVVFVKYSFKVMFLFLFSKTLDSHCTVEKCQKVTHLCSLRRTRIAKLSCNCDNLVDISQMDIVHVDLHLVSSFPSLVVNQA